MSENQKDSTSLRLDFSKINVSDEFDNLGSSSIEVAKFQSTFVDAFIQENMNDLDAYWKNIEVTASTPKNSLRHSYGFGYFAQEPEKDESTNLATNIHIEKPFEADR